MTSDCSLAVFLTAFYFFNDLTNSGTPNVDVQKVHVLAEQTICDTPSQDPRFPASSPNSLLVDLRGRERRATARLATRARIRAHDGEETQEPPAAPAVELHYGLVRSRSQSRVAATVLGPAIHHLRM